MGNDGAEIDQNPAAVGVPFGSCDAEPGPFDRFDDSVGDRTRLNLRSSRGENERVRNDGASLERQDDDVFGLLVECRGMDDVDQIGQVGAPFGASAVR